MEKAFELEIVTPKKTVFKGHVLSVSAPGAMGGFQVLVNHAPLLSSLRVGQIKVVDPEGTESRFATSGGFLEVRQNVVTLLAETAERAEEIDVQRAREAQERSLGRMKERSAGIDVDRARLALQRAINRLKIAGKA